MVVLSKDEVRASLRAQRWLVTSDDLEVAPRDPQTHPSFKGEVCTDGMASAGQAHVLLYLLRERFCAAGPFRGGLLYLYTPWAPEGEDIVVRQLLKGAGGPTGELGGRGYHFGPDEYDALFSLLTLCFAFSWQAFVVLEDFEMAVKAGYENRVTVTLRNPDDAATAFLVEMGFEK
jgi:hypothetical protein